MSASLTVNIREFTSAIRQLAKIKNDTLKNIVNQAALDVAGYAFDITPPIGSSAIERRRSEIKGYLRTILAQKFKWNKKGTKTRKAGRASSQLQRVHLIVQARRKKRGQPGLYGAAMKAAAGKFVGRSQNSVGFLKSVFIPIIRRLNTQAKYKFPFARTKNISRWPGGAGYGKAELARSGWNALATIETKVNIDGSQVGKIGALQNQVMREAINWKAGKMKREVEKILSAEFFKVNPKRGMIQARAPRRLTI